MIGDQISHLHCIPASNTTLADLLKVVAHRETAERLMSDYDRAINQPFLAETSRLRQIVGEWDGLPTDD